MMPAGVCIIRVPNCLTSNLCIFAKLAAT
jgi:hypothetical protein